MITNNGRAIDAERGQGVNVILTGGELRYPKEAMVGDYAIRNLQTVIAKKAFVGCSGIDAVMGMTTENANEVTINQLMVRNVARMRIFWQTIPSWGRSAALSAVLLRRFTI